MAHNDMEVRTHILTHLIFQKMGKLEGMEGMVDEWVVKAVHHVLFLCPRSKESVPMACLASAEQGCCLMEAAVALSWCCGPRSWLLLGLCREVIT